MADPLVESAVWRRLQWHCGEVCSLHLRDLFESDPTRGERLTAEAAGLYLDYSKQRLTDDTLQLLRRLAAERRLSEKVRAMFRGEAVNTSEGRPALHVALRMPRTRSLVVDGVGRFKRAAPRQQHRQHAAPGSNVNHDEDRRRECRGQLGDDLQQGLEAAGRRADHDDGRFAAFHVLLLWSAPTHVILRTAGTAAAGLRTVVKLDVTRSTIPAPITSGQLAGPV